jgi:hypothetical protein
VNPFLRLSPLRVWTPTRSTREIVTNIQWNSTTATTPSKKAAALGNRFFPIVEADLTDLRDLTNPTNHGSINLTDPTDHEFTDRAPTELHIDRTATEWEVYKALKRAKPDKCPGIDEIPNRFLHAMGEPLIQAPTALINECWAAEYFPKQFRAARTIVLRKPDKPDYSDPGAWRPITLLSTLGKIMESVMAQRLGGLAE